MLSLLNFPKAILPSFERLSEEVNGMYDLTAPAGEVPKYCQRGREAWLYYASDGRWHFGVGRVADRGAPGHHLRSCECRVGTLPVDVCGWEIYDRWAREARPSFTASATRCAALLKGTDRACCANGQREKRSPSQVEASGNGRVVMGQGDLVLVRSA